MFNILTLKINVGCFLLLFTKPFSSIALYQEYRFLNKGIIKQTENKQLLFCMYFVVFVLTTGKRFFVEVYLKVSRENISSSKNQF